jgi:hypothetical protein
MKQSTKAVAGSLVILLGFMTSQGQVVQTVTETEYEQLMKSPEKMEVIKSEGIVIEVEKNRPVVRKVSEPIKITEAELASYKEDRAKYAQFIKDNDGNYAIIADPVMSEIQPLAAPSSQDLQKMELQERLNAEAKSENFIPMRKRSGDDVSVEENKVRTQSENHGSGMGGNADDKGNSISTNGQSPASNQMTQEERNEANRKFDTESPN